MCCGWVVVSCGSNWIPKDSFFLLSKWIIIRVEGKWNIKSSEPLIIMWTSSYWSIDLPFLSTVNDWWSVCLDNNFFFQLQSALWISFAIVGITAYYCHMDLDNRPNALGSLLELTFFKVYFSGPCDQQIGQNVDFTVLQNLSSLEPPAVHGVIWAYLMLSFFWLISSVTLLTSECLYLSCGLN